MAFVRVLGLVLIVLLAVHAVLSVWLRLQERRRLVLEWETTGQGRDRDAFLRDGMATYDRSLRKRLLWLVVVLPMATLTLLLYVLNVS